MGYRKRSFSKRKGGGRRFAKKKFGRKSSSKTLKTYRMQRGGTRL